MAGSPAEDAHMQHVQLGLEDFGTKFDFRCVFLTQRNIAGATCENSAFGGAKGQKFSKLTFEEFHVDVSFCSEGYFSGSWVFAGMDGGCAEALDWAAEILSVSAGLERVASEMAFFTAILSSMFK